MEIAVETGQPPRTAPRSLEGIALMFKYIGTTHHLSRVFPVLAIVLLLPATLRAQFAARPMPPAKNVRVYGQRIRYYEAGHGPAVIFLHGLGGQSMNFTTNIGPVSRKFHAIAFDEIGFGDSDKPLVDYDIMTLVDFLYGFMKALHIQKATLVGVSMGGHLALQFAVSHPDMVDRLVLVDSGGLKPLETAPRPNTNVINHSSMEAIKKDWQHIVYNKSLITDEMVQREFERHMRNNDGYAVGKMMASGRSGNDYEDDNLGKIHVPTLVIWGENDNLVPLAVGERLQKGIAGAKLIVIKQGGHAAQLEHPDEFNRDLLNFLGDFVYQAPSG
jgi:pimeloyl-ACP methyl ester carboxylesterase